MSVHKRARSASPVERDSSSQRSGEASIKPTGDGAHGQLLKEELISYVRSSFQAAAARLTDTEGMVQAVQSYLAVRAEADAELAEAVTQYCTSVGQEAFARACGRGDEQLVDAVAERVAALLSPGPRATALKSVRLDVPGHHNRVRFHLYAQLYIASARAAGRGRSRCPRSWC